MKDLDYIKAEIERLNSETTQLPFSNNDTRRAFHDRILDTLDNYHKSWSILLFLYNKGKFPFDKGTENFYEHVGPIQQDFSTYSDASRSYRNYINRSMIIDSWSTFEFSITAMVSKLLDDDLKNELKFERYSRVKDIIKSLAGVEEKETKLKKELEIKHISSISINRKYDKLFKVIGDKYSRNVDDDKLFLRFFGTYRNVTHSNFTFFGNDFSYTFQDVSVDFKHGQLVGDGLGKMNLKRMFDLVLHLRLVFMAIGQAFSNVEEINEDIA